MVVGVVFSANSKNDMQTGYHKKYERRELVWEKKTK